MKKISLILFLVLCTVLSTNASNIIPKSNNYCDLGITFEISSFSGWGYGEPVILTVQPFSVADKAGLKSGDIIMEVNGKATYLRNYQTIFNWLSDSSTPEIKLTIRNVDTYFKEYSIDRLCKPSNSMSEFTLATAYSFYSIEDTSRRGFSLPLKIDPNQDIDFTDYHTFDFISESDDVPEVDHLIDAEVQKAMEGRGLVRSTKDPDIFVQTYYTFQPNPKYDSRTRSKNTKSWRFDSDKQEMVQLPILSAEDLNAESKGQYLLELGVRFFEKKYVDTNKLTQIWDCKSREFLTDQMSLQEYARIHAPLMLMQYPYSSPKTIAKYVVDFKRFNYTGINFDANDMATVASVDTDSPAYNAGIRQGDKIQKINGLKFNHTIQELENGYRRFIVETMKLRDKRTRFIDANGFPDCMYWDKTRYNEIADSFKKEDIYSTSFSYLYSFEKYISGPLSTAPLEVEFKDTRGNEKTVRIVPLVQKSTITNKL